MSFRDTFIYTVCVYSVEIRGVKNTTVFRKNRKKNKKRKKMF